MNDSTSGLLDRTLRSFRRAWRLGKERRLRDDIAADLPDDDLARLRARIDECLEGVGGEVTARARAAELGEVYLALDGGGRRRFLELLATDYGVDPAPVEAAISALREATDGNAREPAMNVLRKALVPPRVRLLAQFNGLAQGVKFLVDLRAELRRETDTPELRALDRDLREMLASWFDIGFLELARITWHTPAALLEKLIEYEAVHAIRSWDDLKNRLEADRRCYAFFHPQMPDEPLIFVQVALVEGMSDNVQGLLDPEAPLGDPELADTAIFYSISNCQAGLAGVSFGSFLIKRVVDDVAREWPRLKTFATLSPMPGFRAWLDPLLASGEPLLGEHEGRALRAFGAHGSPEQVVRDTLARPDWHLDPAVGDALRPALTRLAARYLVEERHRDRALDRVAHFHLTNGARIERINWLADTSTEGLRRSAGLMVNYRYRLDEIESAHENYIRSGEAAAAPAVRRLLRG